MPAQKQGRLAVLWNNVVADKEQKAPFPSANYRAVPYETNTPPPHFIHPFSCINIMQLWASEKLLMQRGNPYFCQLPHLKCNQRHSGGSWNLNQHQNSRREGPCVLYCTRPAGEALISIANSINSGRGVLFISLKKNCQGRKKRQIERVRLFSWFLKNHTPECNEVEARSESWREEKWSRTKHLETDKNSSLKVLTGTAREPGQFVCSLAGKRNCD